MRESMQFHPAETVKTRSSEEWLAKQRGMKEKVFLAPDQKVFANILSVFSEIERQNNAERVDERSMEAPFESVETEKIVRAPSLRDWGSSYHSTHDPATYDRGENAVIEIARKISSLSRGDKHDDTALENAGIFTRERFPIVLKAYEGPRGPIFLVQDGSHRVAAAKLVGLDHVRGRVGEVRDKTVAKIVWFEALALMSEDARNELRTVYDQVYPPTMDEKQLDESALKNAETYLDEILAERNLTQEVARQRVEAEEKRWRETELQFEQAEAFLETVTNKKDFEKLRRESALAVLKQHPHDPIWEEHEMRVDETGYLVRKDGGDGSIPVTSYDIGDSYKQILISAVEAYKQKFL